MKENVEKEKETQKSRLKYKDYHEVSVKCKTTTPILGGIVGSPELCLHYDCEQINVFERLNGEIFFPARWFRAMLRGTSNIVNLSSTVATKWLKYRDAKVNTNGREPEKLEMTISPEVAGHKRGRQVRFEKLEPPIEFETTFLVPFKGVGLKKFKKWMEYAGKYEGTGAFRKGFGQFELIKVKDLGEVG